MKEKTAIPVNRTVGISITTADPTLVPKKEIAAIQPLQGDNKIKRAVQQPGAFLAGSAHPSLPASLPYNPPGSSQTICPKERSY